MTNEEAKQAKIRAAWGSAWDRLPDELKQEALLDQYGSIPCYPYEDNIDHEKYVCDAFSVFGLSEDDYQDFEVPELPTTRVRPYRLIGIENNNGWRRIAEQKDLPKNLGEYLFRTTGGDTIRMSIYIDAVMSESTFVDFMLTKYSHWRYIEKHPEPLY